MPKNDKSPWFLALTLVVFIGCLYLLLAARQSEALISNIRKEKSVYLSYKFAGGIADVQLLNRESSSFTPPREIGCSLSPSVNITAFKEEGVIQQALNFTADIAGFRPKWGMLSPIQWRPEFKRKRNSDVSIWFSLSHKKRSGCLTSQPPFQFPGCEVFINHHYRFIWIKGKRVGGTSIRESLGWICDDDWLVPSTANMDYCSEPFHTSVVSLEEAEKYWEEYFVFSFIRNPYARFVSGYKYTTSLMGSCPTLVNFGKGCDSPFLLAKMCSLLSCCWPGSVTHHVHHAVEQSSCLFTDQGNSAVDFIGQTERLEEDLKVILEVINQRKDPALPPLTIAGGQLPTINSQGDKYKLDLYLSNVTCLMRVEQNYLADFERLGYDRITEHV